MRFGGLQFGTNFATQPTLVTAPLLAARGEAVVPSTVDVFINGQPAASEAVPPGPFTIRNLPAISGAGELQVVVTDALGRQQVISQPYYSGRTLLRAGLNEYSVELGAIREDYALESFAYGELLASGTFRRGFSDTLTAEVRAEAQVDGARALGIDTAWQIGTVGVLSATAAAGADDEASGWLAGLGIERNERRTHLFARTQLASEDFVQIGASALAGRPRTAQLRRRRRRPRALRQPAVRVRPAELLGLGPRSHAGSQLFGVGGRVRIRQSVRQSLPCRDIGNRGVPELDDAAAPAPRHRREPGLATRCPHRRQRRGHGHAAAEPAGRVGHRVFLSASSSADAQANVFTQGRVGQAGVEYSRRDEVDGWRATALGGLALTAAGLLPTRWLEQSFAVVQVADFPDLTVYVENQPVGRTDSRGRVLLDGLRPYDTNEVSLDPAELPLDVSLANPRVLLTPAYRSGAVVRFPIIRATAATMRLVQQNGAAVPAGAQVLAPGGEATVALDGLVYLTNAGGHNEAEATWPGHRCRFSFERPNDGDPSPDLGRVVCHAQAP